MLQKPTNVDVLFLIDVIADQKYKVGFFFPDAQLRPWAVTLL